MRVLLVCEESIGFYPKYVKKLCAGLSNEKHKILLLFGNKFEGNIPKNTKIVKSSKYEYLTKVGDEHRYLEVYRLAKARKVKHVHFIRIVEAQRLFLAIDTLDHKKIVETSFSIFGLNDYYRKPIIKKYLEVLVKNPKINSILVHTINPNLLKTYCNQNNILKSKKISFIHFTTIKRQI